MEFQKSFKKGNKVFMISSWNDKGAFYIKRLTIESWGKKRATATEDGTFIKNRIYPELVNKSYYGRGTFIFADTVDANVIAMELAAAFVSEQIRFIEENRVGNEAYNQKLVMKDLEEARAMVPSVVWK